MENNQYIIDGMADQNEQGGGLRIADDEKLVHIGEDIRTQGEGKWQILQTQMTRISRVRGQLGARGAISRAETRMLAADEKLYREEAIRQ